MFSEEEQRARHPPSSLVPRLHVVHFCKLQSTNPLVSPLGWSSESKSSMYVGYSLVVVFILGQLFVLDLVGDLVCE